MAASERRIVVCGAGIMGCSTAYYLAKKGVACTVIDRCGVGCAASGKAGGFLARHWCDGSPLEALAQLSFDMHAELGQVFANTDYRRMHTVAATLNEERPSKKRGSLPDWANVSASGGCPRGTPEDTAQVHPFKLTSAFMESASKVAGSVFRKGVVQGVEITGQKVTGVNVDGETIPADVVVITMGPWTGQARNWLNTPNITGHRAHSILIRPQGEVGAHALFLDHINKHGKHEDPEIYPRPDGDVYLCGMGDEEPLPVDPSNIQPSESSCKELHRVASSVSSRLAFGEMTAMQACYLPISPDGNPIIGPVPGVEGAFIATGHSCWGILNGPATGAVMAELIVDGKCSLLDVSAFDPKRLK